MLTLYYAPHTCSLASHIALEDVGAAYELRRVDFAKTQQQSPDYLKINPKARVPATSMSSSASSRPPRALVSSSPPRFPSTW